MERGGSGRRGRRRMKGRGEGELRERKRREECGGRRRRGGRREEREVGGEDGVLRRSEAGGGGGIERKTERRTEGNGVWREREAERRDEWREGKVMEGGGGERERGGARRVVEGRLRRIAVACADAHRVRVALGHQRSLLRGQQRRFSPRHLHQRALQLESVRPTRAPPNRLHEQPSVA